MKKIIVLLISLTIIMLTTACQATPQKDIVINKSDGIMQEKIIATENNGEITTVNIPQNYQKEILSDNQKTKINIDAKVICPDKNKFPVAKIAPILWEQSDIDQIIKTLYSDEQLYVPREKRDWSKEEILEKIIELKAGVKSDLRENDPEKYKEFIAPAIAEYEALLATAPDEALRREDDGMLKQGHPKKADVTNGFYINVEAELGKIKPAWLAIDIRNEKNTRLSFSNYDYTFPQGKIIPKLETVDVSMPLEEAQNLAERTINSMGLDNMTLASAGIIPNGNHPEYDISNGDEGLTKCYIFYFTREVNDIPVTYAIDSYGIEGNEAINQYNEFWRNEYAEVTVDDTGVLTINYFSPTKVIEIINDNVEMMSFDKIIERFETQMQIGGAWYSSDDIESREIKIEKITLGLCRIANKDKQGEYLLVPAWDFFGQCTETYKDGSKTAEEYKEFIEDDFGHSYLTINAIDGSIIDRSLGY